MEIWIDILEETTATKNDPVPSWAAPGRDNLLLVQMARATGAQAEGTEHDGQTAGFGSALAPASYPAGPVTVSALELLCWLGNRFSFLTEIEILLPDMASVKVHAWVPQSDWVFAKKEEKHSIGDGGGGGGWSSQWGCK